MISRYFSFILYTHICGIARSAYAWCWKCDGLNSRPKHAVAAMTDARVTLIVLYSEGGVPWLKTGVNSRASLLEISDKGRVSKGLVVCLQCFGSRAFVNCTC